MSVVMPAGRRIGVMEEHPPKHITRDLLPGPAHRPKPGENVLSFLSHFGFGAVAGSAFAAMTRDHRTSAPIGTAYGLAIWLASYGGWVPSLGILPPVSRDYPGPPAGHGGQPRRLRHDSHLHVETPQHPETFWADQRFPDQRQERYLSAGASDGVAKTW
ncbi:hypothetical protein [Streptosporangium sp. NPDC087985]|uniref:hypothetical protein n=1 Tax=Streptosporangium sp. NPDC087985 TaxID=3366196 RepID=UPI0037FADAA3